MIGVTYEQAMAANRIESDGVASAMDFIGKRQTDSNAPQSFLVRAGPDHVIPGHFHAVDQFQIFVEGNAKLGRFDLQVGSIHYTDAFTTYGPIIAADSGYAYFTLRPASTTSYHKMPGAGKLLGEARPAGSGRGRMLISEIDEGDEAADGIAPLFVEDDGVGAYRLAGGPGEAMAFPPGAQSGRFILILSGSAEIEGQSYGPKSCLWIDEDEKTKAAVAGAKGVIALLATFRKQAN